jgi:hypothetical protein
MDNYTIAVLAGWIIAVWALCSVLFSSPSKFSNLGRSKGRWFFIELAAFIPYFGFIAVLFYLFKVRVHFPPRVRQPARARPARSYSTVGSPGRSSASSPSSSSWTPPPKQRCGVCQGGTNPCYGCSNGYVSGTQTERHMTCGGTGRVKCAMCNGTGYR